MFLCLLSPFVGEQPDVEDTLLSQEEGWEFELSLWLGSAHTTNYDQFSRLIVFVNTFQGVFYLN